MRRVSLLAIVMLSLGLHSTSLAQLSGPTYVCAGDVQQYGVSLNGGGIGLGTYTWSITPGAGTVINLCITNCHLRNITFSSSPPSSAVISVIYDDGINTETHTKTVYFSSAGVVSTNKSTACSGESVQLTASGLSGFPRNWQYRTNQLWQTVGTFTNPYTHSNLSQDTWFRVRIATGTCGNLYSNEVFVNVDPRPNTASANSASRCGPGTVNLSGSPGSNGNTLRWYTSSSGGSHFRQSTSYSPNLSGTQTYYISSYNTSTGCESNSRVAVTGTIYTIPGSPSPVSNARCGSGTVSLSASVGSGGNTVRWYTSSTGGSHFRQSTSYAPSLTSTTTYYISSYHTSTGCESGRVAITATVNPIPASPSVSSNSRCGTGTVSLSATPGTNGNTIRWYTASSGGSHFRQSTTYSPNLSSTTTYYVSSYHTSTGCESNARVAITATVNAVPATPTVTEDTHCGPGVVNLSAAPGANANTIRWYTAFSGGAHFRQNTSYAPNLSTTTTYYVTSYNSTTGCESSPRVALTASIYDQPANPNPVTTFTRFGVGELTLEVTGAVSGETYQWFEADDSPLAGEINSTLTRYFNETTIYKVEIIGAYCSSERVGITGEVKVLPEIKASNSGFIENGTSVTLSLNTTYSSYQWKRNGANLSGATFATYAATIPGQYSVVVTLPNTDTKESRLLNVRISENSPTTGSVTPINADPGSISLSPDMNYVRTYTARIATTNESYFEWQYFNQNRVSVNTTYIGGLGRPVQEVVRAASPTGNDLVQAMVYDQYNRQPKEYLPYAATSEADTDGFRANAVHEQYQFYRNGTPAVAVTGIPFSEKQFEPSPLNRVIAQGSPGESWQLGSGHEAQASTNSNSEAADGAITLWDVDDGGALVQAGAYNGNTLIVTHVIDEEGNVALEYQDQQGQTILRKIQNSDGEWLATQYVYDAFGNLRLVLPPELSKRINDLGVVFSWTNATHRALIDTWAFQYKYDERQRPIEKRVPGMDGWVYMVYDQLDRLILTQDPVQRGKATPEWTFTKYDVLSRPVLTGIYASTTPYATLRNQIKAQASHEEKDGNHNYTNTALPDHSSAYLLNTTWYDDYDLPAPFTSGSYGFVSELGHTADSRFDRVLGQVTASRTRNLKDDTWLYATTYYDDRYRIIQTVGTNVLGTMDRVTSSYFFNGTPEQVQMTHQMSQLEETVLLRTYAYDHADRLLTVTHQVDSHDPVLLSSNEYNELGELIEKNLHSEDHGSTFIQSVDYRYNIRGWLTSINNAALDNSSPINDDTDDYFGMELSYDHGFTQTWHNGNISGVTWQNAKDGKLKSYSYVYDALNRIRVADYAVKNGSAWTADVDHHRMQVGGYDFNGNIESLQRHGLNPATGTYVLIDDLTYNYGATTSNRLMRVTDAAIAEGFNDGNTSGDDYRYDENGNLTQDLNKGITTITYNHLNLPERVEKDANNYILYTYDAAGIKLKQEVYESGSLVKTTDYVGEFIYENDALQFIQHEEGRYIPPSGGNEGGVYQYHLRDQLGNTRVTFTSKPMTLAFSATLETDNGMDVEEEALFMNLDNTRVTFSAADANGDGGNEVSRVNGTQPMGIGLALPVEAGDTLDMQVNVYYEGGTGYSNSVGLPALVAAVAGGFGGLNGGTLEQQATYDLFNNSVGTYGLLGTGSNHRPAAYLNYILFDENLNHYQNGHIQVSTTASFNHELLQLNDIVASQDGFVYVFLTNESASTNWVYFDDMVVKHTQGDLIIQADDYMPFGLTFNSYQRVTARENLFLMSGKERQKDLDLNWDDFGARMYQSELGRWNHVDPLAEKAYSLTPYRYAFNNPVNVVDPDGMFEVNLGYGQSVSKTELTGAVKSYRFGGMEGEGEKEEEADDSPIPMSDMSNVAYSTYDADGNPSTNIPGVGMVDGEAFQQSGGDDPPCPTCGWNFFVGVEGDVSAGVQGGFNLAQFVGININVASVILAEGKINNLEGASGRRIKSGDIHVKQGISASYLAGLGYTHSFDVINGRPKNESHEIKFGVTFLGGTLKFDENWNLQNAFVGFDGFVGGAFLFGLNGALKIGGNYKPGN